MWSFMNDNEMNVGSGTDTIYKDISYKNWSIKYFAYKLSLHHRRPNGKFNLPLVLYPRLKKKIDIKFKWASPTESWGYNSILLNNKLQFQIPYYNFANLTRL